MAKTDWNLNDKMLPEDMNSLGQEVNDLRRYMDNMEIPPASLTTPGITQLSNSTNSSNETMAATPRAVKAVAEAAVAAQTTANSANSAVAAAQTKADQAFTLGVEQKSNLVAALNSIGVAAATAESWPSLIAKITAIIQGARWASGSASVGSLPLGPCTTLIGQSVQKRILQVNGLNFKAGVIVVYGRSTSSSSTSPNSMPLITPHFQINGRPVAGYLTMNSSLYMDEGSLYINETGFAYPIDQSYDGGTFYWHAFELRNY